MGLERKRNHHGQNLMKWCLTGSLPTPSGQHHTTTTTTLLHKFHLISSRFEVVDNWSGTEPFSSFLYSQGLMNTSLLLPSRTTAGTCGLQSFGRKTLTAGFSVPPRERIPAVNAQVHWVLTWTNHEHFCITLIDYAYFHPLMSGWFKLDLLFVLEAADRPLRFYSTPLVCSAARKSNTRCFYPAGAGQAEFIIRIIMLHVS